GEERDMKKKWLLLFLGLMTIFALAACTANEDEGEEPSDNDGNADAEEDGNTTDEEAGTVLDWNNGEEPTPFNPSIGFDELSYDPLNNLLEGLTRLDEEGVAQPATAEDFDVSDDGLVYTFEIREDANWSNGDPVVAEDFEYAWKLMLDPELD